MRAATARRSPSDQPISASASPPADARMLASGVRRSWLTDSSRALWAASLRRATSASFASAASRSRCHATPSWSAVSDSSRVASRPGGPSARGRVSHTAPSGSLSASTVTRNTAPSPASRRGRLGWWARTHWAGSGPGRRTRAVTIGPVGNGPLPRSATTTSASPRVTRMRVAPVSARRRSRMAGSAACVDSDVTSVRLTTNRALASRNRRSASAARWDCDPASRAMVSPTSRNTNRSSHSRGSSTAKVKRGWMYSRSYATNARTAARTAGTGP